MGGTVFEQSLVRVQDSMLCCSNAPLLHCFLAPVLCTASLKDPQTSHEGGVLCRGPSVFSSCTVLVRLDVTGLQQKFLLLWETRLTAAIAERLRSHIPQTETPENRVWSVLLQVPMPCLPARATLVIPRPCKSCQPWSTTLPAQQVVLQIMEMPGSAMGLCTCDSADLSGGCQVQLAAT